MPFSPLPRATNRGVTLLELVTVILVIAILVVILLPVYAQIQRRTDKIACIGNLHGLYVGIDLYMQEHHNAWPQIASKDVEPEDNATHWISTLQPYGLNQINWLCPTLQKNLGNPDMTDHDNARLDYSPMAFDANPQTAFRWAKMPWFVERTDVHGNGQLLIFSDGHVVELGDFLAQMKQGSPSPPPH